MLSVEMTIVRFLLYLFNSDYWHKRTLNVSTLMGKVQTSRDCLSFSTTYFPLCHSSLTLYILLQQANLYSLQKLGFVVWKKKRKYVLTEKDRFMIKVFFVNDFFFSDFKFVETVCEMSNQRFTFFPGNVLIYFMTCHPWNF